MKKRCLVRLLNKRAKDSEIGEEALQDGSTWTNPDEDLAHVNIPSFNPETFEAFIASIRSKGKTPKIRLAQFWEEISKHHNQHDTMDANSFTEKVEDDPLIPIVYQICLEGNKRKAEQIVALRVSKITTSTEFFVYMNGFSRPQNDAISKTIQEELLARYNYTCNVEGTSNSGWIILDFEDVIVNIMTPRSREYYNLESLWEHGEQVDLSSVIRQTNRLPKSESASQNGQDVAVNYNDAALPWSTFQESHAQLSSSISEMDSIEEEVEVASDIPSGTKQKKSSDGETELVDPFDDESLEDEGYVVKDADVVSIQKHFWDDDNGGEDKEDHDSSSKESVSNAFTPQLRTFKRKPKSRRSGVKAEDPFWS